MACAKKLKDATNKFLNVLGVSAPEQLALSIPSALTTGKYFSVLLFTF